MYECRECNYSTPNNANFQRHKAVHQKTFFGNFKCSQCNYRSTRKETVLKHLARKHNEEGTVITAPEQNEAPIPYPETMFVANFQCDLCNFSCTKKQDLIKHQSTGHMGAVTGQDEKPKTHPDPSPEPLPDPYSEPPAAPDPQNKIVFTANFQCSVCNYKNAKKENVIKHQVLKHGVKDNSVPGPVRKRKLNSGPHPESENEDDESEPAKRLLLAECGLIWHSDEFPKRRAL